MPQFQNLYVGLNENGEVVMWRLTKSTSCEEIDDLVLDLKERLTISGDTLEIILCFHVTSLFFKTKIYESFCSSSFIRCKTL